MTSIGWIVLAAVAVGLHLWFYVGLVTGLLAQDWPRAMAFALGILALEYRPTLIRTKPPT
jgi:hypothetical protein